MSKGDAGEKIAEYEFNRRGWIMHRHQPPTKVVKTKNGPTVIHLKGAGGIADFTGYYLIGRVPVYLACEVKERKGKTVPCSDVRKDQRDWMESIPEDSRHVGIYWKDAGTFEVFPYKRTGSYKMGTSTI